MLQKPGSCRFFIGLILFFSIPLIVERAFALEGQVIYIQSSKTGTLDVHGIWTMSTKITYPEQCKGTFGKWVMNLDQAGAKLSGEWQTTSGSSFTGQVTGVIKGSSMKLVFDGVNEYIFKVSGDRISGKWSGGSECIPAFPGPKYGSQGGVFTGRREMASGIWKGIMKLEFSARCSRKTNTLPVSCSLKRIGNRIRGKCALGEAGWKFTLYGRKSDGEMSMLGSGEKGFLTLSGKLNDNGLSGTFKHSKGSCYNKQKKHDIEVTIKGTFSLLKQ